VCSKSEADRTGLSKAADHLDRPQHEHNELEEELHEKAHIDYDRVAIVSQTTLILSLCVQH